MRWADRYGIEDAMNNRETDDTLHTPEEDEETPVAPDPERAKWYARGQDWALADALRDPAENWTSHDIASAYADGAMAATASLKDAAEATPRDRSKLATDPASVRRELMALARRDAITDRDRILLGAAIGLIGSADRNAKESQ